ncbi:MAG TPA: CheR family methyltransferase [Alphaproteobacteria bacterium]|nr:CheR family methyltransferase [Alphaproteobacteria bacterium]
MSPEDFDLFAHMVKQRSGLVLTRDKAYFLESRLLTVMRKYNMKSLEDIADNVRNNRDENLMRDITDATTTNETMFFRDRKLFLEFQKDILPKILTARAGKKHLRIWSAACSSGQEAYSLAMMLNEEKAALDGWKIDIIGTDIAKDMVTRATNGTYTQFEVQRGLPVRMLVKYFTQPAVDKWQIKDDIKKMVQFREGNLLQDFGPIGVFDAIFCRNVLTYLDVQTRTHLLGALTSVLATDGYLLLGRSETAGGFERLKPLNVDNGFYSIDNHAPAVAHARA